MRLLAEDTMGMVVDFQERLMPAISGHEEMIQRSVILIQGLKTLGIPLLMTQQYTKGIGKTVPEILEAMGSEEYFDKVEFSCFDNTAIHDKIGSLGRKNVILCGAEAHVCLLQTCIDLKEAGYTPVLVADCVGSRKESDKQFGLIRAQQEGVLITTSEAVLFEMTRKAGTPTFKQISKLVK